MSTVTVTITGELDADRLVSWMSGGPDDLRVTVTGSAPTVLRVDGTDLDLDLGLAVPDRLPCEAAWWVASVIRRRLRRVPDAEACASPGLESVLRTGRWRHPDPPPDPVDAAGVVLFKPGMAVGPQTLRELAQRLAECGYRADRARVLEDEEIARGGLAADHYLPHAELARRGSLTAEERIAFLRIYDRPEFRRRFGARPQDLSVECAYELLAGGRLSAGQMEEWSTASAELRGLDSGAVDGPNEIGDCLFVNVYQDPAAKDGEAVVVVNPHMPGVLGHLEGTGHRAVAVLVAPAGERPLDWARMRREFCGVTDPARALPGSLRGDALTGLFPLRGPAGEPVRRTNNGVHLSNGAVEALQDARTWFGLPAAQTVTGQAFLASGLDPDAVLARPFLEQAGRRRAVASVTDGLASAAAVAALTPARLCEVDDFPGSAESVRRVDLAWGLADRLGKEPGAVAVLATGSVGRNLACPDSDLNLLVLVRQGRAGSARTRSVRRTVDGVAVTVERLALGRAELLTGGRHIASASSFAVAAHRMGLAARFGGLPLVDPEGHGRRLAERAARQEAPPALLAAWLEDVLRRVEPARHTGPAGWEEARTAAYALAVAALTVGPTRFHKPKWVPADLRCAGRPELWDLLRHAWQLGEPDEAGVRAEIQEASKAGGADRRVLADAGSLLAAGRLTDALFCARHAASARSGGARTGRPVPGGPPAALTERLAEYTGKEIEKLLSID
ncbi:hypothetical protein [Streptomyces sp. NBC_00158]|uniref:hypothetical protein n=1 Tax=Streptomyces sp. NBC_00158 TaxID=2903627 RepID=UPI0032538FD8